MKEEDLVVDLRRHTSNWTGAHPQRVDHLDVFRFGHINECDLHLVPFVQTKEGGGVTGKEGV